MADEHAPITRGKGEWKVVSSDEWQVTVVAMCTCGDDDCAWSTTSMRPNFVHLPARKGN